jgi:hypothetical protein
MGAASIGDSSVCGSGTDCEVEISGSGDREGVGSGLDITVGPGSGVGVCPSNFVSPIIKDYRYYQIKSSFCAGWLDRGRLLSFLLIK